ncbi:unnamed protein product, partial [Prorocentrum cordatum]
PTCRGPLFFGQATRGPPLLRPRTCLRPRCLTTPGFLGPPSSAHPVLDVEEYVDANSPAFAALCYDGSHPLEWTALHEGYRDLFERQFCAVLEGQEVEREEFLEWITALQDRLDASEALDPEAELPGSGGLRAVDLGGFLSALTASEDYESFLRVMFRAVAERRRRSAPAPPPGEHQAAAPPLTQEVDVRVPEGAQPGAALPVDFLGSRHELVVPEGLGPGAVFRAAVPVVPPPPPSARPRARGRASREASACPRPLRSPGGH